MAEVQFCQGIKSIQRCLCQNGDLVATDVQYFNCILIIEGIGKIYKILSTAVANSIFSRKTL